MKEAAARQDGRQVEGGLKAWLLPIAKSLGELRSKVPGHLGESICPEKPNPVSSPQSGSKADPPGDEAYLGAGGRGGCCFCLSCDGRWSPAQRGRGCAGVSSMLKFIPSSSWTWLSALSAWLGTGHWHQELCARDDFRPQPNPGTWGRLPAACLLLSAAPAGAVGWEGFLSSWALPAAGAWCGGPWPLAAALAACRG